MILLHSIQIQIPSVRKLRVTACCSFQTYHETRKSGCIKRKEDGEKRSQRTAQPQVLIWAFNRIIFKTMPESIIHLLVPVQRKIEARVSESALHDSLITENDLSKSYCSVLFIQMPKLLHSKEIDFLLRQRGGERSRLQQC